MTIAPEICQLTRQVYYRCCRTTIRNTTIKLFSYAISSCTLSYWIRHIQVISIGKKSNPGNPKNNCSNFFMLFLLLTQPLILFPVVNRSKLPLWFDTQSDFCTVFQRNDEFDWLFYVNLCTCDCLELIWRSIVLICFYILLSGSRGIKVLWLFKAILFNWPISIFQV